MTSRKHLQTTISEPSYPQKTSQYGIPAIYFKLEMGLSFSKNNRAHSASVKYVSKMEEKLHEQGTRQQYEEGQYSIQHPMFLKPANSPFPRHQIRRQQQRQRILCVNARQQHERGIFAPPAALDWTHQVSPVSPLTAMLDAPGGASIISTERTNYPLSPVSPLTLVGGDTSGRASIIPTERTNIPHPRATSQLRLGKADMPWSTDPIYVAELETPIQEYSPSREEDTQQRQLEDAALAAEDLEAFHLAIMSVGSLDDGAWAPLTGGSVRDQWGVA